MTKGRKKPTAAGHRERMQKHTGTYQTAPSGREHAGRAKYKNARKHAAYAGLVKEGSAGFAKEG